MATRDMPSPTHDMSWKVFNCRSSKIIANLDSPPVVVAYLYGSVGGEYMPTGFFRDLQTSVYMIVVGRSASLQFIAVLKTAATW